MGLRTMGVEEEFLLVDPETGRPLAVAAAVLAAQQADAEADPAGRSASGSRSGTVEAELQSQQIETSTVPCTGLDELMREITRARARSSDVARAGGAEIVALGTSPISVDASLFPAGRYQRMASRFGMTADEQLSCGCHVHVQVDSDEEAIGVLDQIRPWLSVLLAVSANSPFWHGADSGYASYRTQVWSRWPSAGPTDLFGTPIVYHQAVRAMINSATILDEGMVYFDARLSRHYPTVELRIADVCVHAQDTALVAALSRALVDTAARAWADGIPPAPWRTELIKLSKWRASRSGLEDQLADPLTQFPAPASQVVETLLDHVRDSLEEAGDYDAVRQLVGELLARGTGSQLQRADYARRHQLRDVVTHALRRTRGEHKQLAPAG
jgi:carboxylate-amine ligase